MASMFAIRFEKFNLYINVIECEILLARGLKDMSVRCSVTGGTVCDEVQMRRVIDFESPSYLLPRRPEGRTLGKMPCPAYLPVCLFLVLASRERTRPRHAMSNRTRTHAPHVPHPASGNAPTNALESGRNAMQGLA